MSQSKLITIAIPNYNYGRYLRQCIDSVISQKGDDIEILIADNCSSDDSWSIIESYNDTRIKAWRHEENIGLYPNWNFLLKNACGTFFKFLGSDDWLCDNFIEEFRSSINKSPQKSPDIIAAILFGHRVKEEVVGDEVFGDINLPKMAGIHDLFAIQESFDEVLLSINYSMPTLNAVRTTLAKNVGGYPSDSMRGDSILFARVLSSEKSYSIVSVNAPVVVARTHLTNDRYRYSRFEAFRDETIFYGELINLAMSDSDKKRIKNLVSNSAAQTLISIPIDAAKKRFNQSSSERIKYVLTWKFTYESFRHLPVELWRLFVTYVQRRIAQR
jgi:glycosyltransferase involved in cell wall biosynthesis